MNAAELDRYLVAERAYDAALEAGKSHDEATEAGRAAYRVHRARQILRSVGVEAPPITETGPQA